MATGIPMNFKQLLCGTAALALLAGLSVSHAVPLPYQNQNVPPATLKSDEADKSYRQALEALVAGKLEVAEAAFRKSLSLDKKYTAALLGMAEVAQQRGKLDETRKFIDQAVALDPKNPYVQASLGRLLVVGGDLKRGMAALEQAAKLNPTMVRPRLDMADTYLASLNDPKKASELYRQVITLETTNGGAYYGLGTALTRLGDSQGAAQAFQQADKNSSNNPLPALGLARVYAASGKYNEAEAQARRALKIQPSLTAAQLELAGILEASGRYADALTQYQKLVAAQPKLAAGYFHVGALMHRQQKINEATAQYNKALAIDPEFAPALNNLANIALDSKDLQNAEALAKRATKTAPKVAAYQDTLATVQIGRGDNAGALQSALAASAAAPGDPAYLARVGVLYAKTANKPKAREYLTKAFAISKAFAGADEAASILKSL